MFSREYLQKSIREGFKGVEFGKIEKPGVSPGEGGTTFWAFPRAFECLDKENNLPKDESSIEKNR